MRAHPLFLAALLVAGAASAATGALARPAISIPPPTLEFAGGTTFAVTGEPAGGGATFSVAALWPVMERVRFGVQAYADDIGTEIVELRDPNDGTPLGPAAEMHRWTWGAAWRAEADVWSLGRWKGGASGGLGLWRVEDDRRGVTFAAGSAVGFRLGADARRPFGRGREIGVAINYHRLDQNDQTAWRRVGRYASAAIEFRWTGESGND